jgi:TolB-like protein
MDSLRSPDILQFGPFRFDRRGRLLFRCAEDGRYQPVSLGSRALAVLGVLAERPGDMVAKDEIMCTVWPGTVVEESNLTVQISALRRVLDAGSAGESCIQTIPGRGYRFITAVTRVHESEVVQERTISAAGLGIAEAPPRLSLAVLPFQNLGGDANEEYLADAITEDLTTNLARLPGTLVIARTSAAFYADKSVDVRRVGRELGVRYVVEGSARRLGEILRVNVQLISTETGTHLWAERFDQDIKDLCVGQDEIVNRLSAELGVKVIDVESARNPDLIDRAGALISTAATIEPNTEHVIFAEGFLLRGQAHHPEAIAVLQQLVERTPNNSNAFRQLAICLMMTGRAREAIPHLQRSIRLDPLTPNHRFTCHYIGQAHAMLGHNEEAVGWHQQALAASARDTAQWRAGCYLFMASAYGLLGRQSQAQRALAEANHLSPYATVRSFRPIHTVPVGLPDAAILPQMRRIQEGLRLAGLRDHVDEAADFSLPEIGELHADLIGRTPTSVPGATTIRTNQLADLIARRTPILIDVALGSWGQSIPGAVGLQGTGLGIRFSEARQVRFIHKIRDLTGGDLGAPIVVFGANAERFTGYNLAPRLVALGYQQVHWYRGGFEAWQVNGLPESDLQLQDW